MNVGSQAASIVYNYQANPSVPEQTYNPGRAPLETISYDIHQEIASKLSLQVLGQLARVSKALREPYQHIVENEWELRRAAMTIGIDLNNAPGLPADIDAILKAPCPFFEGKRVYQTHRLVLIPEGVSINRLGILMKHLREGDNPNVYRYIWPGIVQEIGDDTIEKPYWALVTCDVIPGSRGKTYNGQKELLKKYLEYELPFALEAIALVTTNLLCSGEKPEFLLPEDSTTYTRCKDVIDGWPLSVGAFAPSGLYVSHHFGHAYDDVGVLGLRKLS